MLHMYTHGKRSKHAHVRKAMLIGEFSTCSSMAVDQSLRRQGAAQALLAASERMAGVQTGPVHSCCCKLFTGMNEDLAGVMGLLSQTHIIAGT